MFTLITDRSRYFKVKRGQSAADIENTLNTPVCGQAFVGRIVAVSAQRLIKVTAAVGDGYLSIAKKWGVDENLLKQINGFKLVYPTCKIFIPQS